MFKQLIRNLALKQQQTKFESLKESALKHCLLSQPPDLSGDWRNYSYVALDLETTGLNAKRDSILSMGYIKLKGEAILLTSARHWLVQPHVGVGQSAVFHHLTDDSLAQGIKLSEALERFFGDLQGAILLAHHSPIEKKFLFEASKVVFGTPFYYPIIDTLKLQSRILKNYPSDNKEGSLRLDAARAFHHLPRYQAHNALTDAQACAELFLAQMTLLAPKSLALSRLLGWS